MIAPSPLSPHIGASTWNGISVTSVMSLPSGLSKLVQDSKVSRFHHVTWIAPLYFLKEQVPGTNIPTTYYQTCSPLHTTNLLFSHYQYWCRSVLLTNILDNKYSPLLLLWTHTSRDFRISQSSSMRQLPDGFSIFKCDIHSKQSNHQLSVYSQIYIHINTTIPGNE